MKSAIEVLSIICYYLAWYWSMKSYVAKVMADWKTSSLCTIITFETYELKVLRIAYLQEDVLTGRLWILELAITKIDDIQDMV